MPSVCAATGENVSALVAATLDEIAASPPRCQHISVPHWLRRGAALAARLRAGALPSSFRARDVRLKGWSYLTDPKEVGAAPKPTKLRDWGMLLR